MVSRMRHPSPESDHPQPFAAPLCFQRQRDKPSWDTRCFICLEQRSLLSAAFIWNAKRGATGGSVSPRIKELLWFDVLVRECRHIHRAGDWHLVLLMIFFFIFFCLLSSGSSSYYNCSPFCSTLIPISSSLPFACRRNTTVEISVENKASPSLLSFSSLCHISFIRSDNGSHPAGSGSLGEVDAGPVHLPHRRQLDQRPVRPHRHRDCHHRFWPVWMLRHLQRKPMDAEAGKNL